MLKIPKILAKAYFYAKNHKFLWFFGFFLTGGGVLNFIRLLNFDFRNFDSLSQSTQPLYFHHHNHPQAFSAILILVLLILIAAAFLLAGLARTAIINATVALENKENIAFSAVLKKSKKRFSRVALISLIIDAALLVICIWLFGPTLFLFGKGYLLRAALLAVTALGIFLPLLLIASLVNIFASCFAVIFNMRAVTALKSGFDLFARFWADSVTLLIMLSVIYLLLFFFSTSLLGFIGLLAYGLLNLIESLSVSFPIIIYSSIITSAFIILVLVLLLINAVLNVFTNIAWTLFFLEVVKSMPLPEEQPESAALPVAPTSYIKGD